jgi:hypothetical protein
MMTANLTDDDRADLARFLREAIEADRFPLSPRIRKLRAILDKLEPPSPRPPRVGKGLH